MAPRAKTELIEKLIDGELWDPHALLGIHPSGPRKVLRVWRPDAASVSLLVDGEIAAKLEQIHPAGLFEAKLDERPDRFVVEVAYADGTIVTGADPYTFPPTLGEMDVHLFAEGTHRRLHDLLGAHVREVDGVPGTAFAVWAPNARGVKLVGDFNGWDDRVHPMRLVGASGIWELFVPGIDDGALYKFQVNGADGRRVLKSDPYAFAMEPPPNTASVVTTPRHLWQDDEWMAQRETLDWHSAPMSIYEVHLASWRRAADGSWLGYREAAPLLADYCSEMGFTHVEFLPLAEHPFGGSWGYQVSNYFAPSARFGSPDDLRFLVDELHSRGIGVIVDWVPAHFPKDEWALARFDGTGLYEHIDPRKGEHPDWGTLVFNYGRNEVRNFLIANALYWIEDFHIDGLRVDAVASMLYLDYSRAEGQWVPNEFGGRENLEAIEFMKQLNTVVHGEHPGILMIAEESTAWPGVSRPVHLGGLGFGFKWNMGWMHDTLAYFSKDPVYRRFHHNHLTFSLMYAWSENFVLPLSHDEVVHGKSSLLGKMAGDRWQKFANLRSLIAYMWAHPGKQLLFMGAELGQEREWSHDHSLDWHLLEDPIHRGMQDLVADVNRTYKRIPALWEQDFSPEGFRWIDANDADNNVISFYRTSNDGQHLVCIANLSPLPRSGFRLGLPAEGEWQEVLNTDAGSYGGANIGNMGRIETEDVPWHGHEQSAILTLPPLAVLWLLH